MPFKPEFIRTRCIRFRGGDCSLCAQACPAKALLLADSPGANPGACLKCGICAAACPADAVRHPGAWKLFDTVSRLHGPTTVRVACHALPSLQDETVRLDGCPSSIGLDVLARLALTNVQTTIFLHGDCARCEKGDKLRLFHKTLAAFRELCPADADKFQCVRHKTAQLVEKHSVSRRDFFSLFQPRPAPTETVEQSPSTTVSLPASARANLHSALRTLACSGRLPADFPAAELSISASCNGCGACANTCPTEALECVRASSGFRLLFATWKCIDCGLCETVCLSKSISRGPATRESFMAPAPRTLCAGPLQVCKRCDAKVSGLVNGYCQVCARKLGL